MTLETNSIDRAVEAARFFGPRLGPKVVALRCRVVNRYFAPEDGRPEQLMKMLDQDPVAIDANDVEADLMRDAPSKPVVDPEEAAGEFLMRRLERGDDVPLVEDFPLHPEQETASFQDLATTLQFRYLRAFEHWQGNTHLTLTAIIMHTAEQIMRGFDGSEG